MPVCCCIKYCKNTKRQKDSKIIYRRFPFKNKEIIKYWSAATGRDNWILYSDARICSMHFVHDDYYDINSSKKRYLKPNAMPTQNVHANILQYIQQSIAHKINEYNPNNDILEEEVTNRTTSDSDAAISKDNPNNDILEEEVTNRTSDSDVAISKCSNCNNLFLENKKLQRIIEDLKISQETRLNENQDENQDENKSMSLSKPLSSLPIEKLNEYILYYIGGYIVRKLSNIDCYSCTLSLRKDNNEHNYSHTKTCKIFRFL